MARLLKLVLLCLSLASHCGAKPNSLTQAHRLGKPLPDSMLNKPAGFNIGNDDFYHEYISKQDDKILALHAGIYRPEDQKQILEALRYTENEKSHKKESTRREFASQVLRIRMSNVLETQLKKLTVQQLNDIHQKVKSTLDKVQNFKIPLGSQNDPASANSPSDTQPGELRVGYDILTDNSRLEYLKGVVEVGLYHPSLFGSLLGSKPKFSLISMSLSSNLGSDYPKASLSYPLSLAHYEASLSKSLNSKIDTSLVSSQPLKDGNAARKIEMRFSYHF